MLPILALRKRVQVRVWEQASRRNQGPTKISIFSRGHLQDKDQVLSLVDRALVQAAFRGTTSTVARLEFFRTEGWTRHLKGVSTMRSSRHGMSWWMPPTRKDDRPTYLREQYLQNFDEVHAVVPFVDQGLGI